MVDDLLHEDLWLAAWDADDHPTRLTVIPRCGGWAVLRSFSSLVGGRTSFDARSRMTALAGPAGVRYPIDSARPHWLRPFERTVGFRLIRPRGIRIARS